MSLRRDVSRRAKNDLAGQYKWYVKNAGPDVAERYYDAFLASVSSLLTQPGLGVAQDFGLRRLAGLHMLVMDRPYNSHLIFYRYDSEVVQVVQVVRVIHGARNLPRRLLEEEAPVYGEASVQAVT